MSLTNTATCNLTPATLEMNAAPSFFYSLEGATLSQSEAEQSSIHSVHEAHLGEPSLEPTPKCKGATWQADCKNTQISKVSEDTAVTDISR